MLQEEFHKLYSEMTPGYTAELIGGTVFVREPIGNQHGTRHLRLGTIFDIYQGNSPGVEASDNATVILGDEDEVQPDLLLRVLPSHGGQSSDQQPSYGRAEETTYVLGAPELIGEIAHSSRAIDLHTKRRRYRHAGVIEYIVVCLEPAVIHWFDLRQDFMLEPDQNGVIKSNVFPGLWLRVEHFLQMDYHGVTATLNNGLASAEHKEFLQLLDERRHK